MFSANQKAFVICTRVTSLHSCYTFCTRVTEELHSFLSQSELSNFFVYIIRVKTDLALDCLVPRPLRERYLVISQRETKRDHIAFDADFSTIVKLIDLKKVGPVLSSGDNPFSFLSSKAK